MVPVEKQQASSIQLCPPSLPGGVPAGSSCRPRGPHFHPILHHPGLSSLRPPTYHPLVHVSPALALQTGLQPFVNIVGCSLSGLQPLLHLGDTGERQIVRGTRITFPFPSGAPLASKE